MQKQNIGHWKTPERVTKTIVPSGHILIPKNDAQMVECLTQMLDARGYAMDMPLEDRVRWLMDEVEGLRGKLLARIQEGVR